MIGRSVYYSIMIEAWQELSMKQLLQNLSDNNTYGSQSKYNDNQVDEAMKDS